VPPADHGPEALKHWQDLAPELARFGLLRGKGAGFLAEYCRLSVQLREAHARVCAENVAAQSERSMGGTAALKELLRINHRLLDLGDRLGMSPLARARMGLR
jgi:phage terminase small subunit